MHNSWRLVNSVFSSLYASVEDRENYNISLRTLDTTILKNGLWSLSMLLSNGLLKVE